MSVEADGDLIHDFFCEEIRLCIQFGTGNSFFNDERFDPADGVGCVGLIAWYVESHTGAVFKGESEIQYAFTETAFRIEKAG